MRCDASTKTRGAKAPQKKGVLKCFRQASVDFKGLGKVDIRYNCVHGLYVCRALEHHPRIAPIRNHHLPAHRSDVFLLLAETKTGPFKHSPFDRIDGSSGQAESTSSTPEFTVGLYPMRGRVKPYRLTRFRSEHVFSVLLRVWKRDNRLCSAC